MVWLGLLKFLLKAKIGTPVTKNHLLPQQIRPLCGTPGTFPQNDKSKIKEGMGDRSFFCKGGKEQLWKRRWEKRKLEATGPLSSRSVACKDRHHLHMETTFRFQHPSICPQMLQKAFVYLLGSKATALAFWVENRVSKASEASKWRSKKRNRENIVAYAELG